MLLSSETYDNSARPTSTRNRRLTGILGNSITGRLLLRLHRSALIFQVVPGLPRLIPKMLIACHCASEATNSLLHSHDQPKPEGRHQVFVILSIETSYNCTKQGAIADGHHNFTLPSSSHLPPPSLPSRQPRFS